MNSKLKFFLERSIYRCCYVLICCFIFSTYLLSQTTTDTLRVFIYAGQSNALGRSPFYSPDLFPENPNDSKISYAWNLPSIPSIKEVGFDTLQAVSFGDNRVNYAGEINFCRSIYEAGYENIAMIKVARGGSNLANHWNPTHPRSFSETGLGNNGQFYWYMVNFVESKLKELDSLGIPYSIEAILWHQGEADMTPVYAPRYKANFESFVDSLKVHLDPGIEFYAGSVYNPTKDSVDVMLVRQGQEEIAALKSHVHFVSFDSFYFDETGMLDLNYAKGDGIHYTSKGYFKVGETFADAFLKSNPFIPCDTLLNQSAFSGLSISTINATDCNKMDGSFQLSGNTDGLEFSIDGGESYQTSLEFINLIPGSYQLIARDETGLSCPVNFPGNPIIIEQPTPPFIEEVIASTLSGCDVSDGSITINASGSNLEYSLDRINYFVSNQFNELEEGHYDVFVRSIDALNCIDSSETYVLSPEFCGPPQCFEVTNLALKGIASQSSTHGGGIADYAIDGNTSGNQHSGSNADLQHTQTMEESWWKLDLGDTFLIDSLVIYNRTSTNTYINNRLRDFYVLIASTDIDANLPLSTLINDSSIESRYYADPVQDKEFFTYSSLPGRYVVIKLAGNDPLHMAEVQVFGCEMPPECSISIINVLTSNVSACSVTDGIIRISATGESLEYSIDNGQTYSENPLFDNLSFGDYHVFVRNSNNLNCSVPYEENPIVINRPQFSSLIKSVHVTDISGCDRMDGEIIIDAVGDSLEYRINDAPYQAYPLFDHLGSGEHKIQARDKTFENCIDSIVAFVGSPLDCDLDSCNNNIALFGEATQSSTRGNGKPGLAIDGNLMGDNIFGPDANLQCTDTIGVNWWKLDLGSIARIDSLVLHLGSPDSSIYASMENLFLFSSISEFDPNRSLASLTSDTLIEFSFFQEESSLTQGLLVDPYEARYLVLKVLDGGVLQMAEFEVYGCAMDTISKDTTKSNPNRTLNDWAQLYGGEGKLDISGFPNPYYHSFALNLNESIEQGYLRVTNQLGRIVLQKTVSKGDFQRLGQGWPPGIYWIQLYSELGNGSFKVIKLE